jgi:hypothetical protein
VSGYSWKTVDPLYQRVDWDESPLRCLHVCFVRRSSQDVGDGPRANLGELDAYRRSPLGTAERVARRWLRRPVGSSAQVAMRAQGASWKEAKYRRGECVAIDATPFLGHM